MTHKKDLIKTFAKLLMSYQDYIRVENISTASYLILTTVEAVVHDTVFHNGGKKKKVVIDELTDMIVNYLFIPTKK